MKGAYYNEFDPVAAQWLRNLIAAGHIAPGDVDERSIVEVQPDDLKGYVQCHFFAGIGVWSHALRTAGWPDDRPVWTGSCPCQPFSSAGKGDEFGDERHLWPVWFRLIRERRPESIFGEQVASKDALAWLDHVCADLETEGYAVGPVDTCAAGFGAPHIRQRLYFVADSRDSGLSRPRRDPQPEGSQQQPCNGYGENSVADAKRGAAERHGLELGSAARGMQGKARKQRIRPDARDGINTGGLADTAESRRPGAREHECGSPPLPARPTEHGCVGNAGSPRQQGSEQRAPRNDHGGGQEAHGPASESGSTPGPTNGFWRNAEWLPCRDGKARPTEPGTFPLAHGATARVGRLRAYGNAICAPQATEFVMAFLDVQRDEYVPMLGAPHK